MIAPIVIYSDDTSGNRSKKWNKFDCWLMSFAGLPSEETNRLHNIYYITCSNKLSAIDMSPPLVDDLLQLETGIIVHDVATLQDIFVIAPVMCALCDNVRASELVNHLGSRATMFCRICMVSNVIFKLILHCM